MARTSRKQAKAPVEPAVCSSGAYRACAYLRLSADDARKPGNSLETQRQLIDRYLITAPDIQLVQHYTDNHTTGTNFNRPAFQEMLSAIEQGKIDCILVKDLTRFGRNAIDAGYYLEKYLPEHGVRFIAINDNYDSLEGDGGLILPLKNIINESYALDIGRKCRAVQRQNIKDGKFVGRLAPYGYAKSPEDCHKLIVDETAAKVVREIFDLADTGYGNGEIARTLNEAHTLSISHYRQSLEQITSEKLIGKSFWTKQCVATILADPLYMGDMVQGKTRKINGKQVKVDPSEWICVKNTHPPLVSRFMFERVQSPKENTGKESVSEGVPYDLNLFKSKIFCGNCGEPMFRKRQNKDGIYWFRCETQVRNKKTACTVVSMKESELLHDLIVVLQQHASVLCGTYIQKATSVDEKAIDKALHEVSLNITHTKKMIRSLYESLVTGGISKAEYLEMKVNYEKEVQSLVQEADSLYKQQDERQTAIQNFCTLSEAVGATLLDNVLTEKLITYLVDKILIYPDKKFTVQFRYNNPFGGEQLWNM